MGEKPKNSKRIFYGGSGMRVAVVGVGPIGGILSAHLLKAGNEVIIVDIVEEILRKALERGLSVSGPASSKTYGDFTIKPSAAVKDVRALDSIEVVFVCVKTTAQKAVAKTFEGVLPPETVVVSFQNGIDPEDLLAEVVGVERTLRVVVNYAGNAVEHCTYRMNWFNPPNYVGALVEEGRPYAEYVAQLLNQARLTTKVVDDIKKHAFEKTALNATLCPICALTGMTMGEAMADPDTRRLVLEILKEARVVGEKMGWTFEATIDDWMRYLEKGGPHKPSLAVDLDAGRPTEIHYMNGKICEHGRRVGVPTPYNDAMYWTVLGKERKVTGRLIGDDGR